MGGQSTRSAPGAAGTRALHRIGRACGRHPDALATVALLALSLWLLHPLLACLASCFVDYAALHGARLGSFAVPDARLNAWILAWDWHALLRAPGELYRTNCFHPSELALTGSENLLGIAAQLLPLRVFGGGPVFLHQAALCLSFPLLALTTYALTRWLTRSPFAGLVAGGVAMAMPWRIFEVSHVQLESLQWFPLVWLLLARLLLGEGGRRTAAALSAALCVQLLSSYYLAYFLLASVAIQVLVLRLQRPIARAAALQLLAALVVPAVLLLAVSLPYLESASRDLLEPSPSPAFRTGLGGAVSMLAPKLALVAPPAAAVGVSYYLPLLPALLACVGLAAVLRPSGHRRADDRVRLIGTGLAATALGAFVMMLGPELAIGPLHLSLPADWAARLVPGFEKLRAPFRWGSTIGLVCPVLAGVGLQRIESALARRAPGAGPRTALRAATAVLLLLNVPLRPLPAAPAWREGAAIRAAHVALADLGEGPVLELPWPPEPLPGSLQLPSLYVLASATDWRPMLDGFTGHKPRVSLFLQRIAQRLPAESALEALRRLASLRFILLHTDRLADSERAPWQAAVRDGRLRRLRSEGATWILELHDARDTGDWTSALLSSTPRPETFAGLSRAPLGQRARGGLSASPPGIFRFVSHELGRWALPERVPISIDNRSASAWPGLDSDAMGLVELRATFRREDDGSVASVDRAALDLDVPAGTQVTTDAFVRGPTESGRYRLTLELVQDLGDEIAVLPVPAVERLVEAHALGGG